MFNFFIAAVIFLASHSSLAQSLNLDLPVTKFKLENGLTVLLHKDSSVPLISYHTWYKVGSRDEGEGTTGAAHMLEHMMFKGAKKYSGKDFDRILHENGITNNAFTSWDYTGFYQNLPSHRLELMMDMEVDRMRFLNLKEEDLKSELQVVGEERRWRVDNNPMGLLRETFMGTLYKIHPYTWPVIGYMKDIQGYTVEKLRRFYDDFYVPNNAVLVLAGDIDIEKTKKLVEKYYGQLKPKPVAEKKFPREQAQKRQVKEVESEVQSSSFLVGYLGVEAGHPDSYALDLLASILGGGSSSRLHKKLVYEGQTASQVYAYNLTTADPGSFAVFVSMKPGLNWKNASQVVRTELEKIKNQKVTALELEKVKNQVMKEFVDGLTTIDGKAQALAVNEIIFGNYQKMFSDLEKYKQVNIEDVQMVAQKYLKFENEVVVALNPKKAEKR
jgi:zinc protease